MSECNLEKLQHQIDSLQKENERLLAANLDVIDNFNQLKEDYESLRQQLAARVPDGWKMVPVEPTTEMCRAAVVSMEGNAVYRSMEERFLKEQEENYAEVYAAMLAASPQSVAQPEKDLAFREAASLATRLFKKHFAHEEPYKSGEVVWSLCDSTAGIISQIDNMVSRLVQPEQPAVQGDPVAWSVLDKRTGKHWYTNESKSTAQHYANHYSHQESDGTNSMVVTPLYTHPQPERVARTDKAIEAAKIAQLDDKECVLFYAGWSEAEQFHGIKGAAQ